MNETTTYINSNRFMKFLKNHFIPRKEPRKVLLILDSQASHCSDVAVFDLAAENNVILFSSKPHHPIFTATLWLVSQTTENLLATSYALLDTQQAK
ncbi:hypothetical protein TNIN_406841 [Trichonephila inaurata madagascariensis]|uniref:DDE-1 domain-containing protein n=1 Tax=Trichonephila inaurata madagascariensis TaxID=2747483 RepID=A0A8X7C5L4_9ARAC|nr:hypothetical protein TNIN_499941 [Trichonephila inaurata madagascariensis]GFY58141.1 hypothetical protein TNIN_406841 [Trichonephila inaurata madagascariensis]